MTNLNININAKLNSYSSNRVMIEVVGGTQTGMMRSAAYMLAVPYSQFSQTLRTIHQFGGKIVNVNISSELPIAANFEPISPQIEDYLEYILEEIPEDIPVLTIAQEIPTKAPLEDASEIITDSGSKYNFVVEATESVLETNLEPVIEMIPEMKIETASNADTVEANVLITNQDIESPSLSSLEKSSPDKKLKTPPKSGSGFNKPRNNSNTSAQRSPRKPKS